MGKVRRIFGLLLIIIGIVIIVNVVYKKIVTSQKQNEILEVFESQLVDAKNNKEDESDF